MRTGPVVVAFTSLILLAGCSLLPQVPTSSRDEDDNDDDDSSEVVELKARDLEDLFDADDAPSAFNFDLDFSTSDGDAHTSEVEDYWAQANADEDPDCYDSYSASYLLGGSSTDDDDFAAIALNDADEAYAYASVDARVFDDPDDAADYFDFVADAADDCTDDDGYSLVNEDGDLVWLVDEVSVDDADDLDLPDGVRAIYQEESLDGDFAAGYRVIMLQRANVVVGITVQPDEDSDYDFDDGDALAELIAENLAKLD